MAGRDKHLPLTETAFYTLLALRQPTHGYLAMQKVRELSAGNVNTAAGTMYGTLENLQRQGMICQVGFTDGRRKTYQITPYGNQVLELDIERIEHMARTARETGGPHA